jgi:predicted nucleic acid-binding protein
VDIEALAVDANILVPAMMGGRTRDLMVRLALLPMDLQAPEDALIEVEDHIVDLAGYVRARIDAFRLALASIPVRRIPRSEYARELQTAKELIKKRDPDDAPVVALALARGIPIWSNDKDLKSLKHVSVFTTRELAALLS